VRAAIRQRREHLADGLVAVRVAFKVRHEHVHDDESDPVVLDVLFDLRNVLRHGRHDQIAVVVLNFGQKVNPVHIRIGRLQPRDNGVGNTILCGQQQHASRTNTGAPIGPFSARGDPGGEVRHKRALASRGVSLDNDYLSPRQVAGPQPTHLFRLDLRQTKEAVGDGPRRVAPGAGDLS
jgi:hypothetical protein